MLILSNVQLHFKDGTRSELARNPQEYISKEDLPHELIIVCLIQTTIMYIGPLLRILCTF